MDADQLDRKARRLAHSLNFVRLPDDTPEALVNWVVNQAMIYDPDLKDVNVVPPYGPHRGIELRAVR